MRRKILTVVGARPQFVKAAAVSRALAATGELEEVLVHTGQHYDENMSAVFFSQMGIPEPRYNLGVAGGSHGAMTGRMLECCEEVIAAERPDWTLVYGDTNSTLAGALAAAKLRIPLAHVEAGLRSFNRDMPEELNRVVADQLSDILFAPTEVAVANLCREGVAAARIRMVGDVMLDSALYYATRITPGNDAAGRLSVAGFALATVHRAENADVPERLANIVGALRQLCDAVPVVFPMHPRTRARLAGSGVDLGRIRVIEPVGYLDMLALLKAARLVVTDSGGLQKEAYFFGRPCVTLRAETEWGELVDAGWNVLAGTDPSLIVASAMRMLGDRMPEQRNLYGDGTAAQRIVQTLLGRE